MVASSTRKKAEVHPFVGTTEAGIGSTSFGITPLVSNERFTQTTTSHGNRIAGLLSKGNRNYWYREDIGGSFYTSSVDTRGGLQRIRFKIPRGAGQWCEIDAFYGVWDNNMPANPSIASSNQAQMDAFGTQAIARVLPTNPLVGMGQFLGELRDLPKVPQISEWRDKAHNFRHQTRNFDFDGASRSAANEYLNTVFGWVPFVSDVKNFFAVAKDAGRHMTNYAQGANKVIRRTYHFPAIETTNISIGRDDFGPGWTMSPALPGIAVAKGGKFSMTDRKTIRRWMSAAFTYYLPPIDPNDNGFVTAINKAKQTEAYANRLFGLRLTPDLLYKLTPWSWALDWVSTAGDVVHNWSAFANDGLVLKYSYMMEEILSDTIYKGWDLHLSDGQVINHTQVRREHIKSRTIGTPYGFGANTAAFTAKQWGVIAALGISKQPLSINK